MPFGGENMLSKQNTGTEQMSEYRKEDVIEALTYLVYYASQNEEAQKIIETIERKRPSIK
jgi:23S rRNA maturation mini-RNase III